VSFLGSSLAWFVALKNTWEGRANAAWGASNVWNSGTSYQSALGTCSADLAAMTASANTWQTNANTAYDSGVWGSGTPWSTRYTNLSNGLAADGANDYVEVNIAGSYALDGASGTTTLTLPKTGHWIVTINASIGINATTGGANGYTTIGAVGPINQSGGQTLTSNSENIGFTSGWSKTAHGQYNAGQTQTFRVEGSWRHSGTLSGKICAHFVPTTSYPD
jgi:hypothetical protein